MESLMENLPHCEALCSPQVDNLPMDFLTTHISCIHPSHVGKTTVGRVVELVAHSCVDQMRTLEVLIHLAEEKKTIIVWPTRRQLT